MLENKIGNERVSFNKKFDRVKKIISASLISVFLLFGNNDVKANENFDFFWWNELLRQNNELNISSIKGYIDYNPIWGYADGRYDIKNFSVKNLSKDLVDNINNFLKTKWIDIEFKEDDLAILFLEWYKEWKSILGLKTIYKVKIWFLVYKKYKNKLYIIWYNVNNSEFSILPRPRKIPINSFLEKQLIRQWNKKIIRYMKIRYINLKLKTSNNRIKIDATLLFDTTLGNVR